MTEQLTPIAKYFATRKELDALLADGKLSREQHHDAVLAAQDPCRRELVAAEIVRKSGRPKNQAAGMAAGFSDAQILAICEAIADGSGVEAAINAALDANANAELARQQAENKAKENAAAPPVAE